MSSDLKLTSYVSGTPSACSRSHIPLLHAKSTGGSTANCKRSGLPQRVTSIITANRKPTHIPTRAAESYTARRTPMASVINRPISVGRPPSGLTLPKGLTPVGVSKVQTRQRVSAGRDASAASHSVFNSAHLEDEGRMNAMELRMTSMQDLFDLEKKKTEKLLFRERWERQAQEDKVRQLEQDLLEQRRVAGIRDDGQTMWADEEALAQVIQRQKQEIAYLRDELERERMTVSALKGSLSQQSTTHLTLETTNLALRTQLGSLEGIVSQLQLKVAELTNLNKDLALQSTELEESLRDAERIRRHLHNEVQELRGNIRVFARVRPGITHDAVNGNVSSATIRYPDERGATQIEILVSGESATGTATMKSHHFTFDRIFPPKANQSDVFEEVAHLTQSVLDGYNTCIFAYGQTGSGKTYTLEGPSDFSKIGENVCAIEDEASGLIPRAVKMLFDTAADLRGQGWRYAFEGQMFEIYNEGLQDLLGHTQSEVKHEIKHEKGRTIVSEAVVVPLNCPDQVFRLLAKAKVRRQTAATLINDRSSRSHSIFTVRVRGSNSSTKESCDAVLNLVDLAGSERLSNSGSGSHPTRLKEAQCINKSLSSLADVIGALQQAKGQPNTHIPYRNSTLTWLLKNSIGGNSKTLMLLTLSPKAEHVNESLCSLRFASKVNSTFIGSARKTGPTS